MSLSKSLTSAVAALTVAGAVGLAYAQSTPDTTTQAAPATSDTSQPASNTAPSTDTSQAPAAPSSDTSSSMPASTTTTTKTDKSVSSGLDTTPAPKADRN